MVKEFWRKTASLGRPQSAPYPGKIGALTYTPTSHPKRHLGRFSFLAQLMVMSNRQTHKLTDHATSVAISLAFALRACDKVNTEQLTLRGENYHNTHITPALRSMSHFRVWRRTQS